MEVTSAVKRAVAALEPGGRLVGTRTLTGGVSAEVVGLEIITSAGARRRVVLRRHRSNVFKDHVGSVSAKEYGVLAALHRHGFAVPEPHRYDDSDASGPYLIMDWVDGSTELAAAELPGGLEQMARFLVRLHGLDAASLHVRQLEPIEDPLEAVIPHLPSTAAGRRARATLESGALAHGEPRCVLLHGDYWPGNVLWQDGRLVAVIDWEDACLGDPLADLATARVELLCRFDRHAMERFTAHYVDAHREAIGRVQLERLPAWELYVSASALTAMGQWGLDPAEEALRRRRTENFFEEAARKLG